MTYLEAAQRLIKASERARVAGDIPASLDLALEAAEFLRAARTMEELRQLASPEDAS